MIVTGDRLMQILLAVIGALLLFLMHDFNDRIKALQASDVKQQETMSVVRENVEYIRGRLTGPPRPME